MKTLRYSALARMRSPLAAGSVATDRRGDDERDADQHAGHDDRQRGVLILLDLLLDRERRELGHQPEREAEHGKPDAREHRGGHHRIAQVFELHYFPP